MTTTTIKAAPHYQIVEYPQGYPCQIIGGPDGAAWFTECQGSSLKIGRITASGSITEFALATQGAYPEGITTGGDGNLWFTEILSGGTTAKIGRMTTAGVASDYSLPAGSRVTGNGTIRWGPDGNLWYVSYGEIGRFNPVTHAATAFAASADVSDLAIGPDGNIWWVDPETPEIGRMTTSGNVLPPYAVPGFQPAGIAEGPDGNMWFTDLTGKVGRVTPAGSITEYATPAGDQPVEIVQGQDGNLWFTGGSAVGRLTTSGSITEFADPSGKATSGICAAPDGSIWFTEFAGNIGRLSPTA